MNLNNKENYIALLESKINPGDTFWDNGITAYLNPFSYLFYRKNSEVFVQFDNIAIDGQLLVVLLNMFVNSNQKKTKRFSFDMTSIAPLVFRKCVEEKKSILFIGSTQDNIVGFVNQISRKYTTLNIMGYRNGYFDSEEEKDLHIKEIIAQKPDFVIVGMGSPYQELFLLKLKIAGFQGVGHTCGGFMHQTAKSFDYYPIWTDKLHLRWAYRIWDEPVLFRRYFVDYPISVFLFLKDALIYKLSKR